MPSDYRGYSDRRRPSQEFPWDRILLVAPVVILLVTLLYLATQSVYRVDPEERAVVLRFGKHSQTVGPGLHFCLPLVDKVEHVSVKERAVRLPFGTGQDRPQDSEDKLQEKSLMLTGDLNAARVEWTIFWNVSEAPEKYLFRFHQKAEPGYTERIIHTVAQSVMNRLIGDYSIDEVLTAGREEIEQKALEQTQTVLDEYD
ncbi:MAG: SPFH domain-containing protein, partial [Planctomycetota bacterium]